MQDSFGYGAKLTSEPPEYTVKFTGGYLATTCIYIHLMRVPIHTLNTAGSWVYLAGSWRKPTPMLYHYYFDILHQTKLNVEIKLTSIIYCLGIRTLINNVEIMN